MDQISTQDCMDVMLELGGMDLLDSTADDGVMWDPSAFFPDDGDDDQDLHHHHQDHHGDRLEDGHDDQTRVSSEEDLAMLFFEWLKSNKESISAEDLRSIKLKRSTIECAARRLGGGKEGMKQLLKLILEWVQNHQLQKKRMAAENPPQDQHHDQMMINTTSTTTPSLQDSSNYFHQSNNLVMSPHDQAMSGNPYFAPPPPPWMVSQQFDPHGSYGDFHNKNNVFNNGGLVNNVSPFTSAHQDFNQMMSNNWPHHQFMSHQYNVDYHNPTPPQRAYATAYGNHQYGAAVGASMCNQHQGMFQGHNGDNRLVRLGSSATKEARKKRMARQKRFFSHHRGCNSHGNNQHQTTLPPPPAVTAAMTALTEQQQRHSRLASDANCSGTTNVGHANRGNWMFWSSSSGGAPPVMLPDALAPPAASSVDRGGVGTVGSMQAHHKQYQQQIGLDKRQGCNTTNKSGSEKNLKFLLQKVLKQSDVGNLGRIVLPKGIKKQKLIFQNSRQEMASPLQWKTLEPLALGTCVTGDFVRSNGLQEGDFIVIYSDVKCGKYMIRGVKVRQPGSSKMEARKQGKSQRSTPHGTTSRTAAACSPFVKEMVT
ncbi:hypothetical protein Sjap_006088 [Stephania japonica]|uniref:Uncharacterized protein n=1 Tax=Stephania japonica TaxID=461633 RepID=A0AAP0PLP5_9MAGN